MHKLILEELPSVLAYQTLEREWGDCRKIDSEDGFFELKNPVVARNVYDLLDQVKQVEYAWKLSVRDSRLNDDGSRRQKWCKFLLRGLRDRAVISLIGHLVSEDVHKRNYLEVILSRPNQHYADSPVLEFAERGGLLVGYKVRVPYAGLDLVRIEGRPYRAINALADPARLGRTQGALEGKLSQLDDQHNSRIA